MFLSSEVHSSKSSGVSSKPRITAENRNVTKENHMARKRWKNNKEGNGRM